MVAAVTRRMARGRQASLVKGPSDLALDRLAGRFAIGLRLASAATAALAGPLAAMNGVSGPWQIISAPGADTRVVLRWPR